MKAITRDDHQAAIDLALELKWTDAVYWLRDELQISVLEAIRFVRRLAAANPKSALAVSYNPVQHRGR